MSFQSFSYERWLSSIEAIDNHLSKFSFNSIFLVTGKESFDKNQKCQALLSKLKSYNFTRYYEFKNNPDIEDLQIGLKRFQTLSTPLIVAIGGGSIIDMAKLIRFFASHTIDPEDYFLSEEKFVEESFLIPLIAIPTTAGTGSEATQFATLYINRKKYSLDHPSVLPSFSILDTDLTLNLPPKVTAESGIDALSQAIESYWSVKATDFSKEYSREAIKLILSSLDSAYRGLDKQSRAKMLIGAHLAGKAINITRTTAPHSISYPLTSYFSIAHGQAVGVTLPYFLLFNAQVTDQDVNDPRGSKYVKNTLYEICELLSVSSPLEGKDKLLSLLETLNLKTTLKGLGLRERDYDTVIEHGFSPSRVLNNPRKVTQENLLEIFKLMDM